MSDDPSVDFVAASDEGRKILTIPAGSTSATWSVPTVDDGAAESDGLVTVSIQPGAGYTIGSSRFASVRVTDNDGAEPGLPEISVTGGSAVTEGHDAIFIVRASRASAAAIDIALDVSDDATSDFLAPSSEGRKTVTLPAGATWARYPVPTVDDTTDEPDGRIAARIAASSDYTVGSPGSDSVAVRDNDTTPPGIPEINIRGGTPVTEGGSATFTVRASRASAAAIDIALDVSDDATSDFLAPSSEGRKTVTLPAGATWARYPVPTVDDTTDEPDGRIAARIAASSDYTVGSPGSDSVAVRDNDTTPPGIPEINIRGGTPVTEGGTAVFTLQADRAPAAPIAIGLEISDDATSDFLAASSEGRKTAALTRGSLIATYSVGTVDDSTDEPDGRITARIVSGAGYAVGSPSSGSVDVSDADDSLNPPICGPVTVRNVLTIVNDQTKGQTWYQLTPWSSSCPVVNLGIGGNRRSTVRCDADRSTENYLIACGPWQSQIYTASNGDSCGVEYCLATPLSFNVVRGRGDLASTAGSLQCPDPGSTTFAGIDFASYRCQYIQPGVNNNWSAR